MTWHTSAAASKSGRRSVDGATALTERVNVVLTKEHKRRLEVLAAEGYSPWVRAAIDKAWIKYTKATP
jgi:putative SOS response-associated peptidase YedK